MAEVRARKGSQGQGMQGGNGPQRKRCARKRHSGRQWQDGGRHREGNASSETALQDDIQFHLQNFHIANE